MIKDLIVALGVGLAILMCAMIIYIDDINAEDITSHKMITTYTIWGKKFPIYNLDWKYEIYRESGMGYDSIIKLITLNGLECNDPNGMCLNEYDAGPFQINNIHKEQYEYSKYLIEKFNETGDLLYREKLFTFQLEWMQDRLIRFDKKFCYPLESHRDKMRCQAILHNGNTSKTCGGNDWRYCFGDKAIKFYDTAYPIWVQYFLK